MKKAMKLVWMVLFALPLFALTACGDDDEEIIDDQGQAVTLKDYSDLLGQNIDGILNKKMKDFTPYYRDLEGIYYDNEDQDLGSNIEEVDTYFTFFQETDYDSFVTYEECVEVDVFVYDFSEANLVNYLTALYGKADMLGQGHYMWTKGNKYIELYYDDEEELIMYVDKKKWDEYKNSTKAEGLDLKAHAKARAAAHKARRAAK